MVGLFSILLLLGILWLYFLDGTTTYANRLVLNDR